MHDTYRTCTNTYTMNHQEYPYYMIQQYTVCMTTTAVYSNSNWNIEAEEEGPHPLVGSSARHSQAISAQQPVTNTIQLLYYNKQYYKGTSQPTPERVGHCFSSVVDRL